MAGPKPRFTAMKFDAVKKNLAACRAARDPQSNAEAAFSRGAGGQDPVRVANYAVADNRPAEPK